MYKVSSVFHKYLILYTLFLILFNMRQNLLKIFVLIAAGLGVGLSIFLLIYLLNTKVPAPGDEVIVPADTSKSDKSLVQQLANQSKINKFKNYEELQAYLDEHANTGGMYADYGGAGIMKSTRAVAPTAAPMVNEMVAEDSAGAAGAGPDYSGTNIQVAGVDEADIVKTDGNYIYVVSNNDVFIVDGYPGAESKVLAQIKFDSTPQGLYLSGQRLVVYGQDYQIYNREYASNFRRRGDYTFVKVFDLSDPKNPKQVRDLDFEGYYVNSRMIGDQVYLVTSTYLSVFDDEVPVPRVIENGAVLCVDSKVAGCLHPPVYYFDMPYESYNYTTVNSINIKNTTDPVKAEVYLLSGGQNLYVSENNIYITYTKYISEYQLSMTVMKELVYPKLGSKDRDRIAKIEATENYILSPQEKQNKISYMVERYLNSLSDVERTAIEDQTQALLRQKYQSIANELEKTVIHKIAIKNGELKYQTYGEVPGNVINQFAMDENQGYFRIATTRNRQWAEFLNEDEQDSWSNLYVLDADLKTVGRVEKLALGERIYSVRFMQNRAYLVTFQQTDPLFVLDVSNPQSPRVLGKLKIPGYSNYLHPYDDNLLIGLGRDTKVNEWGGVINQGIKLSLFDVSAVDNPKEVDTYIIGDAGTNSEALNDHHAFLFSKDKNLLVIPVQQWGGYAVAVPEAGMDSVVEKPIGIMPPRPGNNFNGAFVFNITPQGFKLTGKLEHDAGSSNYDDSYQTTIRRSLYIENELFTCSNKYLMANDLSDLDLIKRLRLEVKPGGDDFQVIN